MHIHGNHMNPGITNPYAAAAAEKAAALERAAEVRKKLLKSAAEADGNAIPEEDLMIGRWMGQQNLQGDGFYHPKSGNELDFE
jgi:hypothetical protein